MPWNAPVHRWFRTCFLLMTGLVLASCTTACVAPETTKQGARGERCFTDEDCREPLLCVEGLCQEEVPRNGMRNLACDDFCNYLTQCDVAGPTCPEDCQRLSGNWSAATRQETFACFTDLSCNGLATGSAFSCLEDIPLTDNQLTICDTTASTGDRLCGNLYAYYYELCSFRAKWSSERKLNQVIDCSNENFTCETFDQCVQTWVLQ